MERRGLGKKVGSWIVWNQLLHRPRDVAVINIIRDTLRADVSILPAEDPRSVALLISLKTHRLETMKLQQLQRHRGSTKRAISSVPFARPRWQCPRSLARGGSEIRRSPPTRKTHRPTKTARRQRRRSSKTMRERRTSDTGSRSVAWMFSVNNASNSFATTDTRTTAMRRSMHRPTGLERNHVGTKRQARTNPTTRRKTTRTRRSPSTRSRGLAVTETPTTSRRTSRKIRNSLNLPSSGVPAKEPRCKLKERQGEERDAPIIQD